MMKTEMLRKIENKEIVVGVVGLGYVGLPLAVEKAKAGFKTIGFDVQPQKVEMVNAGHNYIGDVVDSDLAEIVKSGMLSATTDFSFVKDVDFVAICVPTPLDEHQQPDISYVRSSTEAVSKYLKKGTMVVLESTTYPGTTEELIKPILEEGSGLKCGEDFYLGFSPERVDPGNLIYKTKNTPKVVGAIGKDATEVIAAMYRAVLEGEVYEVSSPAVAEMEIPARATIANMGAEMGATTSIFPADAQVKRFLAAQGRPEAYTELLPDEDAEYDETIDINLSELEPLIACPHQPDNVMPLHQAEKKRVQQVFIGSCTNASYADIAKAALVFKGHHVNEDVSCTCAVSSKQVYRQLMRDGYVEMLLDAGVRLLEIACGPCCAIGQTPATDGVAVRTSNRNFKGRAGNPTAKIYLVSPESAAATAIMGTFASAADILGDQIDILAEVHEKEEYEINDNLIIKPLPEEEAKKVEIVRGVPAGSGSTGSALKSAGKLKRRRQHFH